MSCGQREARWLVTWPYGQASAPGRPLMYCSICRGEVDALWLAIPLALLDLDREAVMLALYREGLSLPEPAVVADELELPGSWVRAAESLRQPP